jgi:hypothetical protein
MFAIIFAFKKLDKVLTLFKEPTPQQISNPLHRTALVMIPSQMFAHVHHIYDRQQMETTKAA